MAGWHDVLGDRSASEAPPWRLRRSASHTESAASRGRRAASYQASPRKPAGRHRSDLRHDPHRPRVANLHGELNRDQGMVALWAELLTWWCCRRQSDQ